jgi:hypothetical protein
MMCKRIALAVCMILLLATASLASASDQTITAVASGYYGQYDSSAHGYTMQNYFAGSIGSDPDNNFFVFALSGISGTIQSPSSLNLIMPANGIYAPNGTLTYTLFDVSTPISQLVAGTPSASIWEDLGSGTVYGSASIEDGNAGSVFMVSFNEAGIAALNAANGGYFAVGGSITNLNGNDGYAFGYTNNGETATLQLDPTAVPTPEPTALMLIGAGFPLLWRRLNQARRK